MRQNSLRKYPFTSRQLRDIAIDGFQDSTSGILSASQCLIEATAGLLPQDELVLLCSIESSSTALLATRTVRSVVSNPAGLHFQPTDIVALVERSKGRNRAFAARRSVYLHLRAGRVNPCVEADKPKLASAIEAILAHIIRRSRPGSTIHISIAIRARSAVLTFRGDHAGASLERPTDKCLRLIRNALPRGVERADLLLALAKAKAIIESHDGTVCTSTANGRTLSVVVSLPLSCSQASANTQANWCASTVRWDPIRERSKDVQHRAA